MKQTDIFVVFPFKKRYEEGIADLANHIGLVAECSLSDEGDLEAAAKVILEVTSSSNWILTEMPSLACAGAPEWIEAINALPQETKNKLAILDFSFDIPRSVIRALEVARVLETPDDKTYQFLKEIAEQKKLSK